jgi:multidrug efflux pump subunit AcrB
MTTIAMVFGMFPIALAWELEQIGKRFGLGSIGGLISSVIPYFNYRSCYL